MPGISIILSDKQRQYLNPLSRDFPEYQQRILENQHYYISCFSPQDYPIVSFENENYKVIVEGFIFSKKENLESRIYSIAQSLFEQDSEEQLKDFVQSTDGEYIIYLLNKQSNELLIFNDYLARLPFYYYQSTKELILSREISFIVQNAKAKTSKAAGAEFLLLGFPLGNKTLHQDCFKLRPAEILHIDQQKQIHVQTIFEHNFEQQDQNISFNEAAKESRQLFLDATKSRAKQRANHILSLSGGLDSRAVMAALKQSNTQFNCIAYDNKNKSAKKDVDVAKILCNTLDSKLNLHLLENPTDKHRDLLLKIKQGLNYSGMSFLIPFFEKEKKDQTLFWTGDGGDKIFPDLRPLRFLFSLNDLVNYIYKKHHVLNYSEIEDELHINKHKIKTQIRKQLKTYPEKTLKGKYIHFIIMERGHNWLFEGEDRNRYFMPSITPFYSIPLFKFCMSIPNKYKANFKFFEAFLELLAHQLNNIPNANWNVPISNTKKVKWIYLKQKVKSWMSIFYRFENSSIDDKRAQLETLKKIYFKTQNKLL